MPLALSQLATLLAVGEDSTVAQFVKAITKLDFHARGSGSGSVADICRILRAVSHFLDDIGKPAVTKDLAALGAALELHKAVRVEDIVAGFLASRKPRANRQSTQVSTASVQTHVRALEQSLGDEAGFTQAFHALQTDPGVGKLELIALAKQFAFASVKSGPAALKKIWARHQALMISRAKAAATAGRIAG